MKKLIRSVYAAEDTGNTKLQEMMDTLSDDFDYLIAGLEKLDRMGATQSNEGLIIAERLNETIQDIIAEIGDKF